MKYVLKKDVKCMRLDGIITKKRTFKLDNNVTVSVQQIKGKHNYIREIYAEYDVRKKIIEYKNEYIHKNPDKAYKMYCDKYIGDM